MAALIAMVGLLGLTEHLTGWNLGIDQLLFREPGADAFYGVHPGLISPITAADFLLLGLALLLLDTGIIVEIAALLARPVPRFPDSTSFHRRAA